MEIYKRDFNTKWLKASIVGSIWASFEIVFGSFLHNIKFPMSGTILTIFAVGIIITFLQKWNENGIIIRAGLVAALLKSISPSAVLLGPMTGIFFEAAIVELTIYLLGKNYFAYILSGILALYSVLIHKIITLLILYGLNVVKISENLYYFLAKQLNISDISFIKAVLIISIFYIVAGIGASVLGIIIGNKAIKLNSISDIKIKINSFKSNFFEINKQQQFSSILLIVNLIFIIFAFVLINNSNIILISIITIIYLIFCFKRYPNSLRHLKKVGFWLQIILIFIISILFFNQSQTLSIFNKEGFLAGYSMILRMFILIAGFSAISVELRNPVVRTMLYRQGLANLYQSIGMAFSILPALIKQNTKAKEILTNPVLFLSKKINTASFVYDEFATNFKTRNAIIITGEKGSGKSTFVEKLYNNLKNKNIPISGFIAQGTVKNNKRSGFHIKNLSSDEEMLLASTEKIGKIKIGKFFFKQEAFDFGEEIINSNFETSSIFIIDEIGHLELKNKGWNNIQEKILNNSSRNQIWTVRKKLVKKVIRKFALNNTLVFDIKTDSIEFVAEEILKSMK
ncbi:MAG: nucleoside-triphosphatase [Bacteroidota bacterium]|nr:nucleoside-triphosphatase [Bacteroidota bacterium]